MLVGMGTPNVMLPLSAAACREVDLVGVFRSVSLPTLPYSVTNSHFAYLADMQTHIRHRSHSSPPVH